MEYRIRYLGDLRTECEHESGVKIQTDAPKDNQGKGEAFSPTDLVAVSVGSCMLTMMGLMARRLGVELKRGESICGKGDGLGSFAADRADFRAFLHPGKTL